VKYVNIYFYFYLGNTFQSTDNNQAILTKLRIRCVCYK